MIALLTALPLLWPLSELMQLQWAGLLDYYYLWLLVPSAALGLMFGLLSLFQKDLFIGLALLILSVLILIPLIVAFVLTMEPPFF